MMTKLSLRSGWALVRTGCLWGTVVALPVATALGAPPPATVGGESQSKSYVYQYMLVGLCIAMGMVLLCRPRKRNDEVERAKESL